MHIAILGCGWLGFPLAKALIAYGHIIKGSTTTAAKLNVLQQAGVEPFLLSSHEGGPVGDITAFLRGADVLLIDIPPKAKSEGNYPDKIKALLPYISSAGIKNVLLVSSTSVYADDNSIVTEDSVPNPDTESGNQVLAAERALQSEDFKTTIVRFGGLIGVDRHPIKHLAGRENVANPGAPVNLIHLDDCIGIITRIIDKAAWGKVFNGVSPSHPTREEYYTLKANEAGLQPPSFDHQIPSVGKTVESINIKALFNYHFKKEI